MQGDLICDECGEPYFIDDVGVSHHVDEEDPQRIGWDADDDHVPYGDEPGEQQ